MNVYGALQPDGWTVPGGRAGSVGVAGFLTGGGNSFYTARVGFACDNVKNFELVTAAGYVDALTPLEAKCTNTLQPTHQRQC
jgi:FAD/FMN-containing dehydrogenase